MIVTLAAQVQPDSDNNTSCPCNQGTNDGGESHRLSESVKPKAKRSIKGFGDHVLAFPADEQRKSQKQNEVSRVSAIEPKDDIRFGYFFTLLFVIN